MNFECVICSENGDASGSPNNGLCAITPCGHVFHVKCNDKWIKAAGRKTCATCRRPFKTAVTLFGASEAETEETPEAAAGETPDAPEGDKSIADQLRELEIDFREALNDAREEAIRADRCRRESVAWAAKYHEIENQLVEKSEELEAKVMESRKAEFKLSLFEEKYPEDSVAFYGLMNQTF